MLTGKMFEKFCTKNNIEPIYAPANDHGAVGLVERLTQTIERQLSCMKANINKMFNLEHSMHAIINVLENLKKKQQLFHHSNNTLVDVVIHQFQASLKNQINKI